MPSIFIPRFEMGLPPYKSFFNSLTGTHMGNIRTVEKFVDLTKPSKETKMKSKSKYSGIFDDLS